MRAILEQLSSRDQRGDHRVVEESLQHISRADFVAHQVVHLHHQAHRKAVGIGIQETATRDALRRPANDGISRALVAVQVKALFDHLAGQADQLFDPDGRMFEQTALGAARHPG